MRNLQRGFAGNVLPVNPKHNQIAGMPAYAQVSDLPLAPDLAVICAPPAAIPAIVAQLGDKGTKAAIVITAGLARATTPTGQSVAQAMLEAARPHLLRIIGPNCLGMLVPGINLNASFAQAHALPGKLAFVSQSGALATAILDWGNTQGIGFSCFISVGDSLDVDLGDLLDSLGRDPGTRPGNQRDLALHRIDCSRAQVHVSSPRRCARQIRDCSQSGAGRSRRARPPRIPARALETMRSSMRS